MNLSRRTNKIIARIPGQIFDVPADVESKSLRLPANDLDNDFGNAFSQNTKTPSSGLGEIDDATIRVGAAIIDAYNDIPTVVDTSHPNHCVKGQRPVGRSKGVHVEPLAACGSTSIKGIAVPTRLTALKDTIRCLTHLARNWPATNEHREDRGDEKPANQLIDTGSVHRFTAGLEG
jgi:hypothetical protein